MCGLLVQVHGGGCLWGGALLTEAVSQEQSGPEQTGGDSGTIQFKV